MAHRGRDPELKGGHTQEHTRRRDMKENANRVIFFTDSETGELPVKGIRIYHPKIHHSVTGIVLS